MGLSDYFTFLVDVAFDAGPFSASPTWTEVTDDVLASEGVTFSRGTRSVGSRVGPGLADLTMRNWAEGSKVAGRWTPGVTASPWHPLKLKRRLRIEVEHASVSYPLWSGHITDHTPGWVGAGKATCGLSCSDILAALARAKAFPVGAVLAEQLYDSPVLCYPLDDADGSVTAGDRSLARRPPLSVAQHGMGGEADFGSGSFGPEAGACLALTRVDGSNGKYLVSDMTSLGTSATLEVFIAPGSTTAFLGIMGIQSANGYDWISLGTIGSSAIVARGATQPGGSGLAVGTAPATAGEWSHAVVTLTYAAGTTTIELFVNGVSQGTTTIGVAISDMTTLWVGRDRNIASPFDGQIANVAVYDAVLSGARIAAHYQAMTGWAGESSGYRFARLAGLFGLPSGLISSGSGGVGILGPQAIAGKQITAALNEVADSDRGSINVDPEGALRFSGRTTRHGVATSVTLDARTDILNSLDGLAYNDEDLVNDATVTRDGGATVRHVNQASVDEYGSLTATADVILNSDDDAQALAEWLANVHSQPAIKAPTLRVSMLNIASRSSSKAAALCALDLGQRITVTNLPAGLPATTLELFVEGINDEVGANDWVRTITTSNITRGGAVWVLGDATYSVLGSTTILA